MLWRVLKWMLWVWVFMGAVSAVFALIDGPFLGDNPALDRGLFQAFVCSVLAMLCEAQEEE